MFLANELAADMQRPHDIAGASVALQTRVGVVQAHDGEDSASMLARANDALKLASARHLAVTIAEADLADGPTTPLRIGSTRDDEVRSTGLACVALVRSQ